MTDLIALAAAAAKCKLVWTITGAATAPADFTKSDGYMVKSSCTRVASAVTAASIQGTCVETLDTAGAALSDTTGANMGNYGICHSFTTFEGAGTTADAPKNWTANIWVYL